MLTYHTNSLNITILFWYFIYQEHLNYNKMKQFEVILQFDWKSYIITRMFYEELILLSIDITSLLNIFYKVYKVVTIF